MNNTEKTTYIYSDLYKEPLKIVSDGKYSVVYRPDGQTKKVRMIKSKARTPDEAKIEYYLSLSKTYLEKIQKLERDLRKLDRELNIKELKEKYPERFI